MMKNSIGKSRFFSFWEKVYFPHDGIHEWTSVIATTIVDKPRIEITQIAASEKASFEAKNVGFIKQMALCIKVTFWDKVFLAANDLY